MAMVASRAAAASILRRRLTPALGSGLPLLGKLSGRPSIRPSDQPWEAFSEQVNKLSLHELKSAKCLIDRKLEEVGVDFRTGQEAHRARVEEYLIKQSMLWENNTKVLQELKDKKGDLAAINIGKQGTLNILTLMMVLMKAEETFKLSEMIKAAAEVITKYYL